MPADIIVYAIVAAGLVVWLRSILGTKHGEERERPNPYNPAERPAEPAPAPLLHGEDKPALKIVGGPSIGFAPGSIYSIENKTAENALLDIAEADKEFDLGLFMTGAQQAFTMIVEAFAAGDLDTLKGLLGNDVYKTFEKAIKARKKAKETLETRIHAMRKMEVVEASIEGHSALITVRFTADETSLHKDSEGRIISGSHDEPSQMIDLWSFARDIRSDDPRWLLMATHSEGEDDNDIIPNSEA
ncbi:MAG TPA: Tim44/TimA family putative adaptor protein [Alphaproteobacteria bacterium]|nr:Tim44/TimA family putative adaptor protein [Alphaproteobacteria bacterium]